MTRLFFLLFVLFGFVSTQAEEPSRNRGKALSRILIHDCDNSWANGDFFGFANSRAFCTIFIQFKDGSYSRRENSIELSIKPIVPLKFLAWPDIQEVEVEFPEEIDTYLNEIVQPMVFNGFTLLRVGVIFDVPWWFSAKNKETGAKLKSKVLIGGIPTNLGVAVFNFVTFKVDLSE